MFCDLLALVLAAEQEIVKSNALCRFFLVIVLFLIIWRMSSDSNYKLDNNEQEYRNNSAHYHAECWRHERKHLACCHVICRSYAHNVLWAYLIKLCRIFFLINSVNNAVVIVSWSDVIKPEHACSNIRHVLAHNCLAYLVCARGHVRCDNKCAVRNSVTHAVTIHYVQAVACNARCNVLVFENTSHSHNYKHFQNNKNNKEYQHVLACWWLLLSSTAHTKNNIPFRDISKISYFIALIHSLYHKPPQISTHLSIFFAFEKIIHFCKVLSWQYTVRHFLWPHISR